MFVAWLCGSAAFLNFHCVPCELLQSVVPLELLRNAFWLGASSGEEGHVLTRSGALQLIFLKFSFSWQIDGCKLRDFFLGECTYSSEQIEFLQKNSFGQSVL